MQFTTLGRTGVKVSRLCLGTMSFGSMSDESESAAVFGRCLDHGINFFDCADVYSDGEAERILGRLIKEMRDDVFITSKVASKVGSGVNDGGLSRRHVRRQIERSLRSLDTDRIDLYFVHHFDADTPIEETLRVLDDLVREGSILYLGVSNWAAWQIAIGLGVSRRELLARFECIQPMYNLVKRQAEVEILPLAQAEELGVITYSPLGGGLLTGKYAKGARPDGARLIDNEAYVRRYGQPSYFDTAEAFGTLAAERGVPSATLAVAWVMAHPAVTAPIIGARNVEQLQQSLDATSVDLTPELWAEISALSHQPPPATDRSEER